MPDDVTVVIPTRNRSHMLRRALHSALGQRGVDLQVVVVDEASTDGTPELLARIADDRLVVVRHDRPRGVAAARNAGVAVAAGRWVAFLDDDDVWAPEKVRTSIQALADAPGTGWSCTSAVWLHQGLRLGRPERVSADGRVDDAILTRNVVPGGASNVVADTALVRDVGMFDETFMTLADWDLWTRLALVTPLATVDRPLHGYYVHAGSMAHDVRRTERELALFDAKYADVRRARGLSLDRAQMRQYLGAWALRQGDRRSAARMHWQLAVSREDRPARSLAACVVGALWPGVQHVRDRHAARRLPPEWRRAVEEWLEPLRRLDGDPSAIPQQGRATA